MKKAEIIVYEADDRLAKTLSPLCRANGWRLREFRRDASVISVLQESPPLLVLRIGNDIVEEMTILERASWQFPETATIVVGEAQHPELSALAWDLGAAFVLLPPLPRDALPELAAGLMARRQARS